MKLLKAAGAVLAGLSIAGTVWLLAWSLGQIAISALAEIN